MKCLLRRLFDSGRPPVDLVNDAAELASLPPKTVEKLVKQILKLNPNNYDTYTFHKSERQRTISENTPKGEDYHSTQMSKDRESAEQALIRTIPPGNILHAIERLVQTSSISLDTAKQAMFQFVSGCLSSWPNSTRKLTIR